MVVAAENFGENLAIQGLFCLKLENFDHKAIYATSGKFSHGQVGIASENFFRLNWLLLGSCDVGGATCSVKVALAYNFIPASDILFISEYYLSA